MGALAQVAAVTPATLQSTSANWEYAELKCRIAERGLLRKDPLFYVGQLALALALVAAAFALSAIALPWSLLPAAAVLAFAHGQLTFLGHDAGHNQPFVGRRANEWFGLAIISLVAGGSRCWWVEKHNRHHGSPNTLDADPDIDFPVIAFCESQARDKRGGARFIVAHQSLFFFPLLVFEAWHLRLQGLRYLLALPRSDRVVSVELALILVNLGLYVAAVVISVGADGALPFVLIHHALLGVYLGSTFATNHKGMQILAPDARVDFLRLQVLTSRNLTKNALTDFVFGPLSCQIEHHLFPAMSRSRLRAAAEVVRAYCAERGIPYHETGPLQAYREVLTHLHRVGLEARQGGGASDGHAR